MAGQEQQAQRQQLQLSEKLAAARLYLAHKRPYYAAALWALRPVATDAVPVAACDSGWRVYWNPAELEKRPVQQLAAILEHELLHLLRAHYRRARALGVGAREVHRWNIAADLEINDDIIREGLPPDALHPEKWGLPVGRLAEEYYRQLPPVRLVRQSDTPLPGRQDAEGGQGGMDLDTPGQDGDPDQSQEGQMPREIVVVIGDKAAPGGDPYADDADDGDDAGEARGGETGADAGPDEGQQPGAEGQQAAGGEQNGPSGDESGAGERQSGAAGEGEATQSAGEQQAGAQDGAASPQAPASSPAPQDGDAGEGAPAPGAPGPDGSQGHRPATGPQASGQASAPGSSSAGDQGADHTTEASAPPVEVGGMPASSAADGIRRPWELPEDDERAPGLSRAAADLIRREVAVRIQEHVRARGNVPAGLRRWAEQMLRPKLPWPRLLRAAIRRALADASGMLDYTYRRPSRRRVPGVVLPALRRPQHEVAVVVDTSGSVDDKMLGRALAEIQGVLRAAGAREGVRVLSCDAAVHATQRVFRARQVALFGGGGTDMRVGLAAALRLRPRPHVVVVITDGFTPWPEERPDVPVVVVLLDQAGDRPPWPAKVVVCDDQTAAPVA